MWKSQQTQFNLIANKSQGPLNPNVTGHKDLLQSDAQQIEHHFMEELNGMEVKVDS